MTNNIKIHNSDDLGKYEVSWAVAAECLDFITDFVKPWDFYQRN